MKKIITSWSLDSLADEMIKQMLCEWQNPFFPPIVIFSDIKTEQWFRLHWMKHPDAGNGVLMNLKSSRLQPFLFHSLFPKKELLQKIGIDSVQTLSVEHLRDVMISKLTELQSDGKYYFETLNSDEVKNYLFCEGKINSIQLYDFAKNVSSLFMDYEDTRSESLASLLEKSSWQKKLYNDIFFSEENPLHSGEKICGLIYEKKAVLSLFQLSLLNKKLNGGKIKFNHNPAQSIFVFGFSGMGEIYRNTLKEFSDFCNVNVFLQTSKNALCSEEKTQNDGGVSNQNHFTFKNGLLQKWSSFGMEHLELWSDGNFSLINELTPPLKNDDSQLKTIHQSVIKNEKNIPQKISDLKNATDGTFSDGSLSLCACPSKLREVEILHTKICEILKADKSQVSDILVIAPNIQDYKVCVEQVFSQSSTEDSEFPYVPYVIADFNTENSLIANALKIFYGISQKKYFSRADLFSLLRNNLVQAVRGFSDEDVSSWAEWTEALNVYRDRGSGEEKMEDWQKAKNRLLLSSLTENLIVTDREQLLPYETLESKNYSSLNAFVSAVDELEYWTALSCKENFSFDDIEKFAEFFSDWLFLESEIPENLFGENYIYQNITEEIERQKITMKDSVYASCFFASLFDKAKTVSLHSSKILTSGVTFANFAPNRILSCDYVFFLGLDSKVFPGVDFENVLDLRSSHYKSLRQSGDEILSAKNKNAFLCQLMSAKKGFFLSYVNKNLQKDEDFYPSSVINDLFLELYEKSDDEKTPYEKKISIDENRDWNELYTKREFRNKKLFMKLQQKSEDEEKSLTKKNVILPDVVKIADVKKYLDDPFVFYIEKLFYKAEEDDEAEQSEFEPIMFDSLRESFVRNEFIKKIVLFDSDLYDESEKEKILSETLALEMKNENLLPDSVFGEEALKKSFKDASFIAEKVKEKIPDSKNMIFDRDIKLLLSQENSEKKWTLNGKSVLYNADFESTKKLTLIDFNRQDNLLKCYLSALAIVASSENPNSDFDAELNVMKIGNRKKDPVDIKTQDLKLNKTFCTKILNMIYDSMYVEKFSKCTPYAILAKSGDLEKIKNLHSLKEKLLANQSGCWNYFSKKKMFDVNRDIGYSEENFYSQWQESVLHQRELIFFLKAGEENGE